MTQDQIIQMSYNNSWRGQFQLLDMTFSLHMYSSVLSKVRVTFTNDGIPKISTKPAACSDNTPKLYIINLISLQSQVMHLAMASRFFNKIYIDFGSQILIN